MSKGANIIPWDEKPVQAENSKEYRQLVRWFMQWHEVDGKLIAVWKEDASGVEGGDDEFPSAA